MNATTYQEQAARTLLDTPGFDIPAQDIMLLWNAIGLAGEAGEVAEHIKKGVLHQHGVDATKLGKELGDVLWYVAGLCTKAGLDLSQVMAANIAKLQSRYPNGFTSADSQRRVDLEQEPVLESESQLERDLRRIAASQHFTAQQLRDAVSERNRRVLIMLQQGVTVSSRRIEFDVVVNRIATELESAPLPAPTWPDPMASLRTRLDDATAANAKLQAELELVKADLMVYRVLLTGAFTKASFEDAWAKGKDPNPGEFFDPYFRSLLTNALMSDSFFVAMCSDDAINRVAKELGVKEFSV